MASGKYSTVRGQKNQAIGDYCVVGGYNNTWSTSSNPNRSNNGVLVYGKSNTIVQPANIWDQLGVILGDENRVYANDQITIGYNTNGANTKSSKSIVIGYNLEPNSYLAGKIILGSYNVTSTGLAKETCNIIVGGGTYANERRNAMECYTNPLSDNKSLIYIPDKSFLALSNFTTANKARVNAITEPQDPDNVTTDDMTLTTVSYLGGSYRKSQVAYFSDYDSAVSIPLDGTSVDFITFGTKPDWAQRALVTFRWENELIEKEIHFTRNEGIHLYVVQQAYSTFPDTIEYKHLRIEWDYTNQTLTAAGFWSYNQDMANSGAISGWDRTLTNASTCKILSVVYSE